MSAGRVNTNVNFPSSTNTNAEHRVAGNSASCSITPNARKQDVMPDRPNAQTSRNREISLRDDSLKLLEAIAAIDPRELDLHEIDQHLENLSSVALSIENPLATLSSMRSEIYWLQGALLNRLAPIEKGKKGLLDHGAIGPFLKKHEISSTTASYARWASVLLTRKEVRKLTLEAIRERVDEHTGRNKERKRKGMEKDPKGVRTGWRLATDLPNRLSVAESALANIGEHMSQATDSFDDHANSLTTLQEASESIARMDSILSTIGMQIQELEREVEKDESRLEDTLASKEVHDAE